MRATAIALAAVLSAPAAFAEQNPNPGPHDSRVRTVAYDPSNVIKLVTTDMRSTLLTFGDDETVDLVALGDPQGWSFNKTRNLVFIKPTLNPTAPDYSFRKESNMQIVTLKADGSQRIYQFALEAAPVSPTAPVLAVNMAYPADIAAARRKTATETAARQTEDVARQRLMVDYYYGQRNWQYVARGSTVSEPSEVSDNGESTAFRFPGNSQQPAIYKGQCNAQDTLTTSHNYGDIAVVAGIAPVWCLRLGDHDVTEVANAAFNPVGQNPQTGTTSPDVVRSVVRPR